MKAKLVLVVTLATLAVNTRAVADQKTIDAEVLCVAGITPIFPRNDNGSNATIARFEPQDLKEHDKGGFSLNGRAISVSSEETEESQKGRIKRREDGNPYVDPDHKPVKVYNASIDGMIMLYCSSGAIYPLKEITLGKSSIEPERQKE